MDITFVFSRAWDLLDCWESPLGMVYLGVYVGRFADTHGLIAYVTYDDLGGHE